MKNWTSTVGRLGLPLVVPGPPDNPSPDAVRGPTYEVIGKARGVIVVKSCGGLSRS